MMNQAGHPILAGGNPRLRAGVLLLVLMSACASGARSGDPSPHTPAAQETQGNTPVPTLVILSPQTGDTVTAPVPIRYRVSGLDVRPGRSYLQLYLGEPGSSPTFEFPLTHATGVVFLEAHPMLSGMRTMTFELAVGNHHPIQTPEARVTLSNVIVEGDRVG